MHHLLLTTAELGITIIWGHGAHLAGYRPGERTIRLAPGLPRRLTRSLLAHELGHHALGHLPTMASAARTRQERKANEWAALHLITREAYAEAERLSDGHLPSIAFNLDVSPELVTAYQGVLARTLIDRAPAPVGA